MHIVILFLSTLLIIIKLHATHFAGLLKHVRGATKVHFLEQTLNNISKRISIQDGCHDRPNDGLSTGLAGDANIRDVVRNDLSEPLSDICRIEMCKTKVISDRFICAL